MVLSFFVMACYHDLEIYKWLIFEITYNKIFSG